MSAFTPNQEHAYRANSAKPGYPVTPTKVCPSCKRKQSIGQFSSADLVSEFKRCRTCRKK